MADARIEHVFNCSAETFWEKVFFDEEYNRRLFKEELRFPVWRELKREDRGGELYRVVEVVPHVGELPGPLKAVVGEGIGYEEHGTLDKKTHRYKVEVKPNKMADKVFVKLEMFTEPMGDKQCKRIVNVSVTAKVFGIGGMIEKRMISDLEKSYGKSARFTNTYVAEKNLV